MMDDAWKELEALPIFQDETNPDFEDLWDYYTKFQKNRLRYVDLIALKSIVEIAVSYGRRTSKRSILA